MKHEVRVICRKCDEAQIVYCMYKHMREPRDEEIHDLMDEIRKEVGNDIDRAMYRMARAILIKAQEK